MISANRNSHTTIQNLLGSPLGGGGGGGGGASAPVMPEGVTAPLGWWSARDVEVDGSGNITKILNQGSNGATNDATPIYAGRAKVANRPEWNDRDVFDLQAADAQYTFDNIAEARTLIAVAGYKDGLDAAFDDFDGLISDGIGASAEITGASGLTTFFHNMTYFYDGAPALKTDPWLPSVKRGIAVTNNASFSAAGTLFGDKGFPARSWRGYVGDVLAFQAILSDADILAVHNAIADWYATA